MTIPTTTTPSPFAAIESQIELPSMHHVYYSGHTERFFWKQSKEAIHLYIPVPTTTSKKAITFTIHDRHHVSLKINDEEQLGQALAYPVYTETSLWYFQEVDDDIKLVVVELAKRMDFSNWPSLFVAEGVEPGREEDAPIRPTVHEIDEKDPNYLLMKQEIERLAEEGGR